MRTYAAVAAAAAMIGLGAIYVMGHAGDNAGAQNPTETADGRSGEGVAPGRLTTGTMATFVFKDSPAALPSFSFNGADGTAKTLADWKGKVVLLNLWATWCAPCRKEMPDLDRLKARLGGERFDVVAISVDRGGPDKPKSFLEKINVRSLSFYQDPTARLAFTLNAIGMPATLLIDAEGREIGRLVGPAEWDSPDAHRLIKAHLRK